MFRVSDEQIDFILSDIKQRGVEIEDLQNNLLDHICCLLEKNYKEGDNFETLYNETIKHFFKHALWEIEEETILLLKYKNYYKMKRFLYILLFVSIGYNLFMFSKIGYESYRSYAWMNEHMIDTKSTFKSGLEDLNKKMAELNIKLPKKDYTCIYFTGDLTFYEDVAFSMEVDSELYNPKKAEAGLLKRYKSLDSVAGIYNKNINHIFCFESNSSSVKKRIEEFSPKFKNVIFVPGMHSLLSGYFNYKKSKMKFTPKIFVLDAANKVIYDNPLAADEYKALAKFLKTLSE